MKRLITAISLARLLAACSQDAESPEMEIADGPSKIFDMPYLMRDLDNGLRVIIVPTDYPDIVTLQIPVQTGSRNEIEPGKTGFAHFFEHMMFRGTEKYPADVYADILKKAGADQNAYTTDDYTNYHITFTKDDLEKMIEVEADRFQNLSYSEEAFQTEALAVKGEYLKNFSNPISKMFERVSDLMFTVHTYKHTTMGFIEDIEAMPQQLEYSKIFFDRWYRPEKTVVILVGDVEPEPTFELVKKYWGDWERGDYSIDVPVEPPLGGPKYEHMQWDSPTQPWLVMAYRGPAYDPTQKDMPSLDLISSIYFSDSSELYRQLVIEDQSVDQLFGYFPDANRSRHAGYCGAPDRRYATRWPCVMRSTPRSSQLARSWLMRTRSKRQNRDYVMALRRSWITPVASARILRALYSFSVRRRRSTKSSQPTIR